MKTAQASSILVIDDEEGIRHGISRMFEREGFAVYAAGSSAEGFRILNSHSVDAAVVDIRLKDEISGIELLRELKKVDPDISVIMITGYGSIDSAVDSMKAGASEYFVKPIDNDKLLSAVRKNLELKNLRRENDYLKTELLSTLYAYELVTSSRNVQALITTADKIKNTTATVLLTGESGTGKEMMARYIHFTSIRKEGRFVGVNCAALSESLLLSELFGHEKGAFTGAVERKAGKFELAHGGTLFLDEIGDMSLNVQAKLLRVLEENTIERVGGTRKIRVDIRLIAATNRDLRRLIEEGKFREDLYYRIHVITLDLPPLRERREDIPLLIDHFIRKYNERYNKKVAGFRRDAMDALIRYDWPGNVRELQNVVNQAVLLSEDFIISAPSFPVSSSACPEPDACEEETLPLRPLREALADVQDRYEKKLVEQALQEAGGNKSQAARLLGVTRKTLARKLEKYNISGIS